VLARIDEFLEIDNEDSMAAWGGEYIAYVEDLQDNLPQDLDSDAYTDVIDELGTVGSFLGVDVFDTVLVLEDARSEIDSQNENEENEEEHDYEYYAPPPTKSHSKPTSNRGGSLRELDRIFSGLLEED
jgi:hypothetical protein